MNGLEGKTALVTGGSRGIGAAVALRLAEAGADVAVTYRNRAEEAEGVARRIKEAGRRGLAIRADGADPMTFAAAVDEVAEAFGRLDVLVNNAGMMMLGSLEDLGPEELEETLAVNVQAPYLAARAALHHLTEGGSIINIGSNVAERTVFPGFALYAMSKTALIGLTKGLARDLGSRGITVNLVNPGATDTEANPADGPNAEVIAGFTALGRYAAPTEIAALVTYLAGEGGRYITGAALNADGGFNV